MISRHAVVKGEKHRLHEILHVDEGDVLTAIAHREIQMVAYAFRHHEIVFLAWPVDTRGAKHYVIEIVACIPPRGFLCLFL